jgi:DNA-binding Lrp family transcriptional regulator
MVNQCHSSQDVKSLWNNLKEVRFSVNFTQIIFGYMNGTVQYSPVISPPQSTFTMKSTLKLDATDKKILEILQANSNITNAQLAKEIGLSPAPTLERVNKLETSGVIRSYHAVIDPASVGLGVSTFVMASLKGHNKDNIEKFIQAIKKINEIVECHHITGAGDFILKIVCVDIAAYQQLMLEKVSNIDVVDSLQSLVILSTFKDSKSLPIPS